LNKPQAGARNSLNTGCFRISGLGGDWAVRGANSQDGKESNRLHIPGHAARETVPAKRTFFASQPDGSGVISMKMDAVYPGAEVLRSFAVDYSGASGAPGLFVVVDKVNGAAGEPVWQTVTDRSTPVTVSDNRFLIEHPGGATLQGTVVAPASPHIESVDGEHKHEVNYHDIHRHAKFQRTVIKVSGGQLFTVVMTVQKGKPPKLSIEGKGEAAVIRIRPSAASRQAGQTVRFDGKKIVVGDAH
jgi:hypothetical protein